VPAQSPAPDAGKQLGIQASKDDSAEFRPYGPDGTDRKGTEKSASEQKSPTPPPAAEIPKEDPRIQQVVAQLKSIEEKVKAHEAAHKAAGGAATGPISYSYTRGPDGRNYITGGEVPITISSGKTPQETISRMQQVIQAALAPADPSPQDRAVAAQAATIQQAARQEQASAGQPSTSGGEKPANAAGSEQPSAAQADGSRGSKDATTSDSTGNPASSSAQGTTARNETPQNPALVQQSRRAYSDPAVTGKEPSPATSPPQYPQITGSISISTDPLTGSGGSEQSGLSPSAITGFGPARPVSFYS
jgi:hypothetical protein